MTPVIKHYITTSSYHDYYRVTLGPLLKAPTLQNDCTHQECCITEIRQTPATASDSFFVVSARSSKMLGRASQAVVGGLEGAFQWYGKQVAAIWILL